MVSEAPRPCEDVCATLAQFDDKAIALMCETDTAFRRELERHRGCGLCTGRIFVLLPPNKEGFCWILGQWTDDEAERVFSNACFGIEVLQHAEECRRCIDRIFNLCYRWNQKVARGEVSGFDVQTLWESLYPRDSELKPEEYK